jgi:hypothetical protein
LNFTLEDTRNELELVTPVYFQLTSAAALIFVHSVERIVIFTLL